MENLILPVMIKGDTVIYTSPLVWGGVSYDIKKVLDKSALIGNRFYKIRNKELVKGTVSKNKKIIGIGVNDQASENERNSFISYIKELGIILDIEYLAKVTGTSITDEELKNLAKEVL